MRQLFVFVLLFAMAGCSPAPTASVGATQTITVGPSAPAAVPDAQATVASSAGVESAGPSNPSSTTPTSLQAKGPASVSTVRASAATALPAVVATISAPFKQLPAFTHVFIIVMENREAGQVVGSASAPYLNQLAGQFGRAANYYGIRHPSLPNYLALIGGDTFGVTSDCTDCFVSGDNIASQVERAGRSWRAYMESMPEPCFPGSGANRYAQKHNPFIYFNDIRSNPERCKNIVPLTEFDADLAAGKLPDYVWISPNLCSDMHDCSVATGDAWLQSWVPKILSSPAWKDRGVLFITFDEGTSGAGCCQYAAGGKVDTLVVSPLVRPGFVSQVAYDHYSLLRTIEQAWGLPPLGKAASDSSRPMTDFFERP